MSNLILSKGIIDFLDAVTILVKKNKSNFEAFIVGAEAEITEKELAFEISKRHLNARVNFLGAKYEDEKIEVFSKADLLVFPTLNDVWGLVILEAMQFGLPVIATREGAIPEIVEDGITGFLVDKHRPDQIADKLEILINQPELGSAMGEAGRKKFLNKYTLDTFERNMVSVFQDVLEKIV